MRLPARAGRGRTWAAAAISLIIAAAVPAPTTAQTPAFADQAAEKEMARFAAWLPGRWDNDLQVFFQRELKPPPTEESRRAHLEIAPITGSVLGPHVFAVTERAEAGNGAAVLTRIIVAARAAEGGVRADVFTPASEKPAPELTGADLKAAPCALLFQSSAGGFEGALACPRGRAQKSAPLSLSEHALWLTEAALDAGAQAAPLKLRKARAFRCWTATLKGARHGDSGEGLSDWAFKRGGFIHDQGGELHLRTEDEPAREVFLRLRAVEWPYGQNRPSLTLYVHEAGSPRALSYAWTEVDATRIGINLRWLQASCTAEGAPE